MAPVAVRAPSLNPKDVCANERIRTAACGVATKVVGAFHSTTTGRHSGPRQADIE
jgi:hypothetical protein